MKNLNLLHNNQTIKNTSILFFLCFTNVAGSFFHADDYENFNVYENVTKRCKAFFKEYIESAGNFTRCELYHAKPFRLCTKCFEPYAIMKSLYHDLSTDPTLRDCMETYLFSDRVQIIPTIQKNSEGLWHTSDCENCVSDLHVDEKTRNVTYTVPQDTQKFFALYNNMTECMGSLTMIDLVNQSSSDTDIISVLCHLCKDSYHTLNNYYDHMAKKHSGEVCMDVVDMMNYTRVAWSEDLNCSHRSADAVMVAIIAVAVAVSPLFFYLPLRYMSKEKIMKVLKQNRLQQSSGVSSTTNLFAAGDGTRRRSTPLPPILSRNS